MKKGVAITLIVVGSVLALFALIGTLAFFTVSKVAENNKNVTIHVSDNGGVGMELRGVYGEGETVGLSFGSFTIDEIDKKSGKMTITASQGTTIKDNTGNTMKMNIGNHCIITDGTNEAEVTLEDMGN